MDCGRNFVEAGISFNKRETYHARHALPGGAKHAGEAGPLHARRDLSM